MRGCYPTKIDRSSYQQAEDRLLELHGSLSGGLRALWAAVIAGQVMLVLLLFILVVAAANLSPSPEDLAEIRAAPVLGSAVLLARRLLLALPEAWYLRLLGALLAVLLAGSLFYQGVRLLFSALAGVLPGGLRLPKEPVARVKKLHREAGRLLKSADRLDDFDHLVAPGLAAALLLAAGIYLALTGEENRLAMLLGSAVAALIAWLGVGGLNLLFIWLNGLFSNVLTMGEWEELRDLRSLLREYWLSIDPEEAARERARDRAKAAARKEAERRAQQSASGGSLGMEPGFNAHNYVIHHCNGYLMGVTTQNDLNRIDSDASLTRDQKEAVKAELKRTADLWYLADMDGR